MQQFLSLYNKKDKHMYKLKGYLNGIILFGFPSIVITIVLAIIKYIFIEDLSYYWLLLNFITVLWLGLFNFVKVQ